jgi:Fungal Zn(2)-Cys(6) binuclear cluster domain
VANDFKCDGKLPACTACEKSGRAGECSSANDQFAKGKERRLVNPLDQDLAGRGTCTDSL